MLTLAAFAREKGAIPYRLYDVRRRLRHRRRAREREGFAEGKVTDTPKPASSPVQLTLPSGYAIRLAPDFGEVTLCRLHATVEEQAKELQNLREQFACLITQLFGRRQKIEPSQVRLFEEGRALLERLEKEIESTRERRKSKKAGHGRPPFSRTCRAKRSRSTSPKPNAVAPTAVNR